MKWFQANIVKVYGAFSDDVIQNILSFLRPYHRAVAGSNANTVVNVRTHQILGLDFYPQAILEGLNCRTSGTKAELVLRLFEAGAKQKALLGHKEKCAIYAAQGCVASTVVDIRSKIAFCSAVEGPSGQNS